MGACSGRKLGAGIALDGPAKDGGDATCAEVGLDGNASGPRWRSSLLKPEAVLLPPAGRTLRTARGEGAADAELSLLPASLGDNKALMSILGRARLLRARQASHKLWQTPRNICPSLPRLVCGPAITARGRTNSKRRAGARSLYGESDS